MIGNNIPNIIILGIGHSGTRVAVNIFSTLGWNAGEIDQHGEIPDVVYINDEFIKSNIFNIVKAQRIIDSLPQPWVIKDPRFIYTLPFWLNMQLGKICLLYIDRNINSMHKSYVRRDENVSIESLVMLCETAKNIYESYDGIKFSVSFEQIINIVEKFDIYRSKNIPAPTSIEQKIIKEQEIIKEQKTNAKRILQRPRSRLSQYITPITRSRYNRFPNK